MILVSAGRQEIDCFHYNHTYHSRESKGPCDRGRWQRGWNLLNCCETEEREQGKGALSRTAEGTSLAVQGLQLFILSPLQASHTAPYSLHSQ